MLENQFKINLSLEQNLGKRSWNKRAGQNKQTDWKEVENKINEGFGVTEYVGKKKPTKQLGTPVYSGSHA